MLVEKDKGNIEAVFYELDNVVNIMSLYDLAEILACNLRDCLH